MGYNDGKSWCILLPSLDKQKEQKKNKTKYFYF